MDAGKGSKNKIERCNNSGRKSAVVVPSSDDATVGSKSVACANTSQLVCSLSLSKNEFQNCTIMILISKNTVRNYGGKSSLTFYGINESDS